MADLLVDTDVFVDHLRGVREFDPAGHQVHFSAITRAELLAGATEARAVGILLSPFRELEVNRAVAERAGEIRRRTGVRLPAALLAATALLHALDLVTRNRKDFTRIAGLRVQAP